MIQAFRLSASYNQASTSASVAGATAAARGEFVARILAGDQPIRIAIGPTPVASATSTLLVAGQAEYFLVSPGDKVAIMRAGATDGSVNVSFLTR